MQQVKEEVMKKELAIKYIERLEGDIGNLTRLYGELKRDLDGIKQLFQMMQQNASANVIKKANDGTSATK